MFIPPAVASWERVPAESLLLAWRSSGEWYTLLTGRAWEPWLKAGGRETGSGVAIIRMLSNSLVGSSLGPTLSWPW
jgi:hypothetical protein